MRIGVIGPTAPDDFADNILDVLPRLGHEAISIGTAQPSWGGWTGRLTRRLLEYPGPLLEHWQWRLVRRAKAARVDAVISVESALLPETVAGLRSTGARVALWFPDAHIGRQLMLIAPYDAIFFKDRQLVSRLTNLLDVPCTISRKPATHLGTTPYGREDHSPIGRRWEHIPLPASLARATAQRRRTACPLRRAQVELAWKLGGARPPHRNVSCSP